MAWIETVSEDESNGELAEICPRAVHPIHNRAINTTQIHPLNPNGMAAAINVATKRGARTPMRSG